MGGTRLIGTALAIAAALAVAPAAGAATIEVDVTNDELNGDGDCSLREAVQAANTNAPVSGCVKGQASKTDVVKPFPGGVHPLTIPSTDEDLNVNGDLDLTGGGPVTVKGNARGMAGPLIDAPSLDRAIDVLDDVSRATVQKLNIDGGNVSGLGSGDDLGGGIQANGAPLVVDEVNVEGGGATRGGGIAVPNGNLTLTDSFIGQNVAQEAGAGVYAGGNKLVIARTDLDSNDAQTSSGNALGAGLLTLTERTAITDSTLEFNEAQTTDAAGVARGGGVYSSSPLLIVKRSLIVGNDNDDASASSSSTGAGIASFGDKLKITNSTLYDNDTDGSAGGIYSQQAAVTHVTFSGNDASVLGDHMAVGSGPLKLRNSILATNLFTDTCAGDPGDFVSRGYNVFEFNDAGCNYVGTDEDVDDVGLDGAPLPNGGETFTVPIKGSSPAKDLVPVKKCKKAQGEDQRGFKRPKGPRCDAGAFERGAHR